MIGCEKEVHYLALAIFFAVRKIMSFLIATPYKNLTFNAFSNCQISSSVKKQPLVVIIHGMIKLELHFFSFFTWFHFVLASRIYIIYPATCYFDSYLYTVIY